MLRIEIASSLFPNIGIYHDAVWSVSLKDCLRRQHLFDAEMHSLPSHNSGYEQSHCCNVPKQMQKQLWLSLRIAFASCRSLYFSTLHAVTEAISTVPTSTWLLNSKISRYHVSWILKNIIQLTHVTLRSLNCLQYHLCMGSCISDNLQQKKGLTPMNVS